jgi:tetratricopeptide (TPR) repeat protein
VRDRRRECCIGNKGRSLLLRLLFPILFLGTFALSQTPGRSAEELLQQADHALQEQDYVAAAQALEAYLAQKPEDYRAEFNLAYAYSLAGRRAEAIGRYKSVLAREPELTPAHLNLGILLLQDGHPDEGEGHLRAVLKQQPDSLNANFYLAKALVSLKRLPEAGEAFERTLQLKPDDARAHLGYAQVLQESNPASAEEHLRRAIQIDPSLEEARLNLAALLEIRAVGSGVPALRDEAAEIYRLYLEKYPERRDLRVRLGEIYLAQKQFTAAAEQFEAARADGDSSPPLANELLQTYLSILEAGRKEQVRTREKLQTRVDNPDTSKTKRGNDPEMTREKALALVREVLAQDSRNAEMHLLYGRLQMERKGYREAAVEFRQAAVLQPKSPEGFTNLASALYLSGDYEATVGALAKVSELQKDTPGTYFLRAICLDKLHLRKPALENYQRFLEVDEGQNPDQEFQARQRSKLLTREIQKGIR